MLYRKIESLIEEHLKSGSHKILLVDGARQVGKTYIIRHVGQNLFPNYIEINMVEDSLGPRLFANTKTVEDFYLQVSMVAGDKMKEKENTLIFIDEIQAYPHLLTLLKFLSQDTPENAVMYGIGHGGIEILAVILPTMITYFAVAVLFSYGNVENALSTLNITEQTAAAALPSVQAAAAFDYAMMAMNVIERLLAMLLHIGLTVVVYYGVVSAKKICLPMAIVLHMLADTFPVLYQRSVVSLWAVEIWVAFWTVVIVSIAIKIYRKMKVSSSAESV